MVHWVRYSWWGPELNFYQVPKLLITELLCDLAISLLGIHPRKLKTCLHKKICMPRWITALIHNSQKAETTQMSISWWMGRQNLIYSCDGTLLSNDICYATTWMNLENVMLNEKCQTQKVTHYLITFIWNVRNRQTGSKNDCLGQGRQRVLGESDC